MASFYANPKLVSSTLAPLPQGPRITGRVMDFTTRPNSISIVRTSDFNHYIQPPSSTTTPNSSSSDVQVEEEGGQPPRDDFVLTGFVVVNLTKPKRARSLRVSFVAEVRLAYPDRAWEDDVIFENTMDFEGPNKDGMYIDAGPQLFEYAFVVPSTLAGFDRTPYGRVSHRIQATLIGQPQSTSRFGSFFSSSPARTRSPSPISIGVGGKSGRLSVGDPNLGLVGTGTGGGSGSGGGGGGSSSRSRESSRRPTYRASASSSGGTRSPSYSGDRTPLSPRTIVESPGDDASPGYTATMGLPTHPGSYSNGGGATNTTSFSAISAGSSSSNLTELPSNHRRPSYPTSFTDKRPRDSSLPRGVKWDDIPWLTNDMITSKEMWIIPLPTENREALPLEVRNRSLVAGLGIVPWSLHTDAITVGGLIAFRSTLTDLNPRATVWCYRLTINQRISLTSPRRPNEPDTVFPATNLILFERGKLPKTQEEWYDSKGTRGPEPIYEGDQVVGPQSKKDRSTLTVKEVLRMPDENRLRPSTCPGTITPIKVTHEFSLQFYFSVWGEDAAGNPLPKDGPGRLRKAILTQGTLILSCCCTKKNLALPTYEQSNTVDAKDKTPMRELDCDICACGEPLSELSEREIARDFINEDGLPFGLLDISSSSPPNTRGRSSFGAGVGMDGTDLLRQRLLEHQQGGQLDRGRSGRSKSVYTPP